MSAFQPLNLYFNLTFLELGQHLSLHFLDLGFKLRVKGELEFAHKLRLHQLRTTDLLTPPIALFFVSGKRLSA